MRMTTEETITSGRLVGPVGSTWGIGVDVGSSDGIGVCVGMIVEVGSRVGETEATCVGETVGVLVATTMVGVAVGALGETDGSVN